MTYKLTKTDLRIAKKAASTAANETILNHRARCATAARQALTAALGVDRLPAGSAEAFSAAVNAGYEQGRSKIQRRLEKQAARRVEKNTDPPTECCAHLGRCVEERLAEGKHLLNYLFVDHLIQ